MSFVGKLSCGRLLRARLRGPPSPGGAGSGAGCREKVPGGDGGLRARGAAGTFPPLLSLHLQLGSFSPRLSCIRCFREHLTQSGTCNTGSLVNFMSFWVIFFLYTKVNTCSLENLISWDEQRENNNLSCPAYSKASYGNMLMDIFLFLSKNVFIYKDCTIL